MTDIDKRGLERAAASGDLEAQHQLDLLKCRAEGHEIDWTWAVREKDAEGCEDTRQFPYRVDVLFCWRCRLSQAHTRRSYDSELGVRVLGPPTTFFDTVYEHRFGIRLDV